MSKEKKIDEALRELFIQIMTNSDSASRFELDLDTKLLMDRLIQAGANINLVFCEIVQNVKLKIKKDFEFLSIIIPSKVIEYLYLNGNLDINLALEAGILWNDEEIASYALINGADSNSKNIISNQSLFYNSLYASSKIRKLLFLKPVEVEIQTYIDIVKKVSFLSAIDFIKDFHDSYNRDKAYKYLRSIGKSEVEILGFLDIHDLMVDYLYQRNLSNYELTILSGKYKLSLFPQLLNNYGFSQLHLALIAKDYKLVKLFISKKESLYSQTLNGLTILDMIINIDEQEVKSELISLIAKDINNVDIEIGFGESLADRLLHNLAIQDKVIARTKDKLFLLLKKDLASNIENIDKNYTNIAISHGDDFWSTRIFAFARIVRKIYPIEFYLINSEILTKLGREFLKNFDAVINPGAFDSFPKDLEEFSLNDIIFKLDIEKHYQNMLDISYNFNIPYLGICAGAQHLVLYHQGKLRKVENYNQGKKNISILENSLAHFMILSKVEQLNSTFLKINFLGEVAHHFAGDILNLGSELKLGGISVDNIAMIFYHYNGIRWGIQFHPENCYAQQDGDSNKQKPLLDNFLDLALMHHEFRINNAIHPIAYIAKIREETNFYEKILFE